MRPSQEADIKKRERDFEAFLDEFVDKMAADGHGKLLELLLEDDDPCDCEECCPKKAYSDCYQDTYFETDDPEFALLASDYISKRKAEKLKEDIKTSKEPLFTKKKKR